MEDLTPKVKLVYDYLLTETSRLPVGMLLPSVSEIRDKLSVSQASVLKAFDTLETMGKIRRVPGRGVFVDSPANTGEIAIVINPGALQSDMSIYYSRMVAQLAAEVSAQSKGLQVRLHLGTDMRVDEYTPEKFQDSLALEDQDTLLRLRGVFAFHPLGKLQERLLARGIPVCEFGHGETQGIPPILTLDWNRDVMFRGALDYAKAQGLTDVCFFGYNSLGNEIKAFPQYHKKLLDDYGLTMDPAWYVCLGDLMCEQTGAKMFDILWECKKKPQMIIAVDDVACVGLLTAVNRKRLEIPEAFQLISYANRGIRFPYNREVTRYEVDSNIMAKQAVELLLRQLQNDTVGQEEHILIDPVFVKGATVYI